jgi:GntR family transcriptional regulator
VVVNVDPSAPLPLYHQVEMAVRERISSGEWSPGTQIPPEDQLCEQFRVSRVTIRHALRNLVAQGLLDRERGRGTFVRDTTLTAGARGLTSFSAEMEALGLKAGGRTLSAAVQSADADIAGALELEPGEPVVAIRRLRTGDGRPVGVQTAYLPADQFPELEALPLDGRSLYAVLRDQYGVTPAEAIETFRIAHVSESDAELLQVEAGACAFAVERLTSDAHQPFEFVRSMMRGDRYRVRLVLRNP